MNDDRLFDRTVRAWLEIGPVEAPDRPVLAALRAIDSIPQDRHLPMPWRFSTMSRTYQYIAAIAAVIVIVGGAILVVPRLTSNGLGSAATPAPTAVPPTPAGPSSAVASPASSATPMTSPKASAPLSGSIAFSVSLGSNDQNSQILTVNPDGSGLRSYTTAPAQLCADSPAWSPTGDRIFFGSSPQSAGTCSAANTKHLFVIDVSGGYGRQLTTDSDGVFSDDPVVSPDGTRVAFDRFDQAGHLRGIWLMDTDGSHLTRLTTAPASAKGGDQYPTFSPDGTKIAFVRYGSDTGDEGALFIVGVDGSGLHQIVPSSVDASRPRWSPDGTRIAFANSTASPTGRHINVVNVDGTGLTTLTHEPNGSWAFDPAWSPDGTQIVFGQFRAGTSYVDVVVMNADGSNGHSVWHPNEGVPQFPATPDWVATP
jgi:Tol biopolymer transport system component